jgi:hypothetical protein
VELAAQSREAARQRMDVGVLEAGQDHPAGEVDDATTRPDQGLDLERRPDRDDPPGADGDRLGDPAGRIVGLDTAAGG